jgi:hypothetical protein
MHEQEYEASGRNLTKANLKRRQGHEVSVVLRVGVSTSLLDQKSKSCVNKHKNATNA